MQTSAKGPCRAMATVLRGISGLGPSANKKRASSERCLLRGDDVFRTQGDLDHVSRLELGIGVGGMAFLPVYAASEHGDIGLAGAVRSPWRPQASQLEFFLHTPQLCALA